MLPDRIVVTLPLELYRATVPFFVVSVVRFPAFPVLKCVPFLATYVVPPRELGFAVAPGGGVNAFAFVAGLLPPTADEGLLPPVVEAGLLLAAGEGLVPGAADDGGLLADF